MADDKMLKFIVKGKIWLFVVRCLLVKNTNKGQGESKESIESDFKIIRYLTIKISPMKKFFLIILASCFLSAGAFAQNNNKPKAVFNHLAIFVVDMNKSGDFYMNIVGLDSIPEPFHDGKHIWLRTGPGNSLHIIKGAKNNKEYFKNNHICFSVPSVEVFSENLKKKGIVFEDLVANKNVFSIRPDGVKQLWLHDPDGYWIEINDAKE